MCMWQSPCQVNKVAVAPWDIEGRSRRANNADQLISNDGAAHIDVLPKTDDEGSGAVNGSLGQPAPGRKVADHVAGAIVDSCLAPTGLQRLAEFPLTLPQSAIRVGSGPEKGPSAKWVRKFWDKMWNWYDVKVRAMLGPSRPGVRGPGSRPRGRCARDGSRTPRRVPLRDGRQEGPCHGLEKGRGAAGTWPRGEAATRSTPSLSLCRRRSSRTLRRAFMPLLDRRMWGSGGVFW